jgi:hypothetical protein
MKAYLYLAGLQDQPPAASKWPDIIFDERNEILTITILHLDMHKGIIEFDHQICTCLAFQDQSPTASSVPDIYFFGVIIEILTQTNIHLDIQEGILVFDLNICNWLASSVLQLASYYF